MAKNFLLFLVFLFVMVVGTGCEIMVEKPIIIDGEDEYFLRNDINTFVLTRETKGKEREVVYSFFQFEPIGIKIEDFDKDDIKDLIFIVYDPEFESTVTKVAHGRVTEKGFHYFGSSNVVSKH